MKITETEQESNIRVSNLRVDLAEAIAKSSDNLTYVEILQALSETSVTWIRLARRHDLRKG